MTKFSRGNAKAAKFSNEDVFEMRRLYTQEGWSQGQISRHFGASINTVGRILRGESRQNVPMPGEVPDPAEMARRLAAVQSEHDAGIQSKLVSDIQATRDREVKPTQELEHFAKYGIPTKE